MQAMTSPTSTTRQAANTLILAIQCVVSDSQATLAMFPNLNKGQKDLAIYLMERNGLLTKSSVGRRKVAKENVKDEMVGLMARGIARDQPRGQEAQMQ